MARTPSGSIASSRGRFTPLVVAAAVLGPPTAEERERKRQLSVIGVEGDAWDTAHAVRFFLSRHARFITGQALIVDGGTTSPDQRYRRQPIPLNNLSRSGFSVDM